MFLNHCFGLLLIFLVFGILSLTLFPPLLFLFWGTSARCLFLLNQCYYYEKHIAGLLVLSLFSLINDTWISLALYKRCSDDCFQASDLRCPTELGVLPSCVCPCARACECGDLDLKPYILSAIFIVLSPRPHTHT